MEATEHSGSEDKSVRHWAEPVPETRAGARAAGVAAAPVARSGRGQP